MLYILAVRDDARVLQENEGAKKDKMHRVVERRVEPVDLTHVEEHEAKAPVSTLDVAYGAM